MIDDQITGRGRSAIGSANDGCRAACDGLNQLIIDELEALQGQGQRTGGVPAQTNKPLPGYSSSRTIIGA